MSKFLVPKIILSLTMQAFVIAPKALAASPLNQCQFIYRHQATGQSFVQRYNQEHDKKTITEDDLNSKKIAELLTALSTLNGKPQQPEIVSDEINLLRKIKITFAKVHNKAVVLSNAFWVMRGLQDYQFAFGDKFNPVLRNLKSGDHWIDVGSGSAKALLEFLQQTNNHQIQTTAISVTKPTAYSVLKKLFSTRHPGLLEKHRYLSGKTIEELDVQTDRIAAADLITDLFGAFSYSTQIDQVLAKEISMLKVGGKLFVHTPLLMQIKIFDPSGNKIALHEWLGSIPGVKVSSFFADSDTIKAMDEFALLNGFILERTSQEFAVPQLKLINMSSEIVSERTYISHKVP